MSFLDGLFLLALPLVAVPILLHFYRRRQREVIRWGAMQFLVEAATEGRFIERLEELLLMLLRAGALLVLVLALARPQIWSRWMGVAPEREVFLVLDNSLSMAREVGGESAFERLRHCAGNIIEQLSEQDRVQVLLAAGGGEWFTSDAISAGTGNQHALLDRLGQLEPSRGTADWLACLRSITQAEPHESTQVRHVMILTDGQAHGWHVDAKPAWLQLRRKCADAKIPTTLEVVDCGYDEAELDNLSIVSLDTSQTLIGPGDPVTVSAQIKNMGKIASNPATVRLRVNSDSVDESLVSSLKPGQSTQLSWKHVLTDKGVFTIGCSIERPDQLPMDNDEMVVVEVVDTVPVLVAVDQRDLESELADAHFLTAALGYKGDKPHGDWHSVFTPRVVTTEEVLSMSLSKYHAIVIANPSTLPPSMVRRLRSFVERGGGLWVALGSRTACEAFNATWFDEADGLSPLALTQHTGDHGATKDVRVHPPSSDHMAVVNLADTQRLDIDEVHITRFHRFAIDDAQGNVSVLLETGDGVPLAVENYLDRGRVIVQAMPLGLQWSNLPLTKAFVVMVHDWLAYLTQPAAVHYNVPPGGPIELAAPADVADTEAELRTPIGRTIKLTPQVLDETPVYRYSQTYLPGQYLVRFVHTNETVAEFPFSIARDVEESNLTVLSASNRAWLAENGGVRFTGEQDVVLGSVGELPNRKSIWWPLLYVLLLLMAAELALSTRSARQRYAPVLGHSWG